MISNKISLLKYLKMNNTMFYKISIPRIMINDLYILTELCAVNGVHLSKLITFIFGIGYELFSDFYHRGNMKSVMQMLISVKYMRKMFNEVMNYGNDEWFMNSSSYMVFHKKCIENNIEPDKLFKFIDQNRVQIFDGVLLITPEKAEAVINIYIKRMKDEHSS